MIIAHKFEETPIGLVMKGDKAIRKYALEYTHNGSRWATDLYAENDEDAKAKLESMKQGLILLGEITDTIPAI